SVWEFVTRFADMQPYLHTVRARVGDEVFPLPITLQTINQFFRTALGPAEARALIESKRVKLPGKPRNFADQALSMFGHEIYEAFFRGYTMKQWGRAPEEIPADVLTRLPFRFNYDQNYYAHHHQGIPKRGYTELVAAILEHPSIEVQYGVTYSSKTARRGYDHVVFTGPLDQWFDYAFGRLPYRTLDFEHFTVDGDYQGCPVMNFCDAGVPFTRITEHKHFAPWQTFEKSFLSKEYSREAKPTDEPFYPVRLAGEQAILQEYMNAACQSSGVSFVGRLATFRYIDMDVAIAEGLEAARGILQSYETGAPVPAFFGAPG
ncbi:MAG TPA: UDP-galactopyranose mutase, partial [Hyphomicrobiaceae bacterium]|nr:UDP-galactopyranose mutase [Hyphomicrobiaceae bacterium]